MPIQEVILVLQSTVHDNFYSFLVSLLVLRSFDAAGARHDHFSAIIIMTYQGAPFLVGLGTLSAANEMMDRHIAQDLDSVASELRSPGMGVLQ
jgi:hypothetical protein